MPGTSLNELLRYVKIRVALPTYRYLISAPRIPPPGMVLLGDAYEKEPSAVSSRAAPSVSQTCPQESREPSAPCRSQANQCIVS